MGDATVEDKPIESDQEKLNFGALIEQVELFRDTKIFLTELLRSDDAKRSQLVESTVLNWHHQSLIAVTDVATFKTLFQQLLGASFEDATKTAGEALNSSRWFSRFLGHNIKSFILENWEVLKKGQEDKEADGDDANTGSAGSANAGMSTATGGAIGAVLGTAVGLAAVGAIAIVASPAVAVGAGGAITVFVGQAAVTVSSGVFVGAFTTTGTMIGIMSSSDVDEGRPGGKGPGGKKKKRKKKKPKTSVTVEGPDGEPLGPVRGGLFDSSDPTLDDSESRSQDIVLWAK